MQLYLRSLFQTILLTLLVVCLCLSQTAAVWAEESAIDINAIAPSVEQSQSPRSGLDADDISSEKVNRFVQAYLQMMSLNDAREGDLQGAETEPEFLRVQQEMDTEVLAIIESTGLTWQEFLQLWDLANIDPEFGERIAAQLQEMK